MVEERYNLVVDRIGDIKEERTVDVKFRDYFVKVAEFIHLIDGTKKKIEDHTFDGMQIEELAAWNKKLSFRNITGRAMQIRIMRWRSLEKRMEAHSVRCMRKYVQQSCMYMKRKQNI